MTAKKRPWLSLSVTSRGPVRVTVGYRRVRADLVKTNWKTLVRKAVNR